MISGHAFQETADICGYFWSQRLVYDGSHGFMIGLNARRKPKRSRSTAVRDEAGAGFQRPSTKAAINRGMAER